MISSELKYKVTIQEYTATRDDYNDVIETWTNYKTTFAAVQYVSGGENVENSQVVANVKVKFKIRYDSGITEKMKVVYNGNDYNIRYIEVKNRLVMFLHCDKMEN